MLFRSRYDGRMVFTPEPGMALPEIVVQAVTDRNPVLAPLLEVDDGLLQELRRKER